jgi:transposase
VDHSQGSIAVRWPVEAIAFHLEAITFGDINRLLINVPPGFMWLNRCRRLAKDWENLNRNALAFLKLASIRLMLRKLCNP